MVGSLTRRLLRDWKYLSRHYMHDADKSKILFRLKPQDSNLHIWHVVIYNLARSVELYIRLFIGSEEEPVIVIRCLTPNDKFPINRDISLTHINYLLVENGFLPLLQRIWDLFFENPGAATASGELDPRFHFAWNRIICRDFKVQFPELLGTLAPGDCEMVKSYSRRIKGAAPNLSRAGERSSFDPMNSAPGDKHYNKNNLIACDDNLSPTLNSYIKRRWSSDKPSDAVERSEGGKRRKG